MGEKEEMAAEGVGVEAGGEGKVGFVLVVKAVALNGGGEERREGACGLILREWRKEHRLGVEVEVEAELEVVVSTPKEGSKFCSPSFPNLLPIPALPTSFPSPPSLFHSLLYRPQHTYVAWLFKLEAIRVEVETRKGGGREREGAVEEGGEWGAKGLCAPLLSISLPFPSPLNSPPFPKRDGKSGMLEGKCTLISKGSNFCTFLRVGARDR